MDLRANDRDLGELFAHQEWVRALALRLCGDHAAADDLVQDTWVEALRGRTGVRSMRSWLGGIVRHRWRRARLRATARADREASTARAPMPSPEGMLAQAELQRRVLAAVASLEEAERTVVLLRYYEGLSGEAIAGRLSVPSSTVRTRLARAHEKLRERLDGEYGNGAWSALLIPLTAHSWNPLHTGVGVAMKLKLAAVAACIAAGATWLWFASDAVEPTATRAAALARAQQTSEADGVDLGAHAVSSASSREPIVDEREGGAGSLLLFGSIEGPSAAEVAKATLRLVDPDGSSRSISAGANATYSAFGLRAGTVHLYVRVPGFVPREEDLLLTDAAASVQHDVVLEPAFVVPVRFVDRTSGDPLISPKDFLGPQLAALATRSRPARIPDVLGRLPYGSDAGNYQPRDPLDRGTVLPPGCDGVVEIRPPMPVWVSCVLRDTVLESRLVHGNEKEIVFELERSALDAALGFATLRCVDGVGGMPLEGVSVSLSFQDSGRPTTKSDARGVVDFTKLAPGLQRLEVTAPDMSKHLRMVRILSGEPTDLGTVELLPGTTVTGRVLDASGTGLDARVTVFPLMLAESPRSVECYRSLPCRPGGMFEIKNVQRGRCRVVVDAKGYALRVIDVDTGAAELAPLDITMVPGTIVRFRRKADTDAFADFMLADENGVPIRKELASRIHSREVVLAPGRYESWSLEDDRITGKDAFEVMGTTLIHEVP